jgi:hypothetical protein
MEAAIRRHISVAIVLMASHRAVPLATFMSSSSFVESSALARLPNFTSSICSMHARVALDESSGLISTNALSNVKEHTSSEAHDRNPSKCNVELTVSRINYWTAGGQDQDGLQTAASSTTPELLLGASSEDWLEISLATTTGRLD